MRRAVAFLAGARSPDFGSRLAQNRWRAACGAGRLETWDVSALAASPLAGADAWVVVREPTTLPGMKEAPEPKAGCLLVARATAPEAAPFVHTLRELEERTEAGGEETPVGAEWAVMAFRTADFPARAGETIGSFLQRLLDDSFARVADSRFRAVSFQDPSEAERPELTRRLPAGPLRILDVGCGAGGAVASGKARNPGWHVTGVERDPDLARRARSRCDRVVEGDLREVLPRLAEAGERFDALVLADVLEHLEDPVATLREARRLAAPGALLLASVPNVGHLSLVRDLLAGRFDPVPAGLCDAGHLRWFTRRFLSEALEEAGWRSTSMAGEPGAPSPAPEEFLALAASWPDADLESLMTYQWIASAVAANI